MSTIAEKMEITGSATFYTFKGRTFPKFDQRAATHPIAGPVLVATTDGVLSTLDNIDADVARINVSDRLTADAKLKDRAELAPRAARRFAKASADNATARAALEALPPLTAYEAPSSAIDAGLQSEWRDVLRRASAEQRSALLHRAEREGNDRLLAAVLTVDAELSGISRETHAELSDRMIRVRHADEIASRTLAAQTIEAAERALHNGIAIVGEATGIGEYKMTRLVTEAAERHHKAAAEIAKRDYLKDYNPHSYPWNAFDADGFLTE